MLRFRKTLASLSAAIICLTSAAQPNYWDTEKSDDAISISAQAGLNLSKFTHVDRWSGTKAGINVGIMAEIPILNSLSAKAGLLYTMKGTVGNNDGGFGGNLKTTFSPSYLEIPLLASYRLRLNDKFRLSFDLGPYFALGLHGKDKKKYSGSNIAHDSETEIDLFTKQLKRFDFGLQFGPSVILNEKYSVGMIFDTGLSNISNMGGKVGNFTFMLNLGYRFASF